MRLPLHLQQPTHAAPTLLPYRAWIMSGIAKDDDSDADGDGANADSTTSSEENVGGAAVALATQDL